MTKTSQAQGRQVKNKKYMLVRYGRLNDCGLFEHNESQIPKLPVRVVIKTDRGLELGELVGRFACYKDGQLKLSQEQVNEYCASSDQYSGNPKNTGAFVRYATAEDLREEEHLARIAFDEIENCRNLAREMNLPMRIIDVEHIFGGERIVFYFLADGRVDFRDMVRTLAREYQCRIEMHQVGARDEARLLGDVETCGQECCCKRFLRALKPVNMRMAKMQKATLDPAKISGFCGRLKCCLRYEDKTYCELKKNLPQKGALVDTPQGRGIVIDRQILTQLVMIQKEDGVRAAIPVDQVEAVTRQAAEQPGNDQKNSAPQDREDRQ